VYGFARSIAAKAEGPIMSTVFALSLKCGRSAVSPVCELHLGGQIDDWIGRLQDARKSNHFDDRASEWPDSSVAGRFSCEKEHQHQYRNHCPSEIDFRPPIDPRRPQWIRLMNTEPEGSERKKPAHGQEDAACNPDCKD